MEEVSKQAQGVAVAAFADDGSWPKPRPNVKSNKDPDRPLLASDDRTDLISLKFRNGEPSHFSIIEASTPVGCSIQPAMHHIPGNSFDSSNCGLVQTLDTERGNLIKRGVTVLESMICSPGCRAEGLPTSPTLVAPTLPPTSLVKAIANNTPGGSFFGWSAVWVWAV